MKSEIIFDVTENLQEWLEQNFNQDENHSGKYSVTEEDITRLKAMVEEAQATADDLIYTKEEANDIYACLEKCLEILKREGYLELEFE